MARGDGNGWQWWPGLTAALSAATLLATMLAPRLASAQGPAGTMGTAGTKATTGTKGGGGAELPNIGGPLDPVVEAAADLIRGRYTSLPRIYVINPEWMRIKTDAPVFRTRRGEVRNPNVFVNMLSEMYKAARTGDPCSLKILAAALAHEIKHSDTKDELPPSLVEIDVLQGFIREPQVSLREQMCLIEREQTVKRRIGMK